MDTRISVGKITPPMESVDFFCSDSIKPENHILFALSLTLDMKALARTRMQRVKKDYKKNEKKYEAEGKRLREFSNMKNIQNFMTFLK